MILQNAPIIDHLDVGREEQMQTLLVPSGLASPAEGFVREVERELTGRETEPHEIIYFKVYKSRLPVIEQALETAALMFWGGRPMRRTKSLKRVSSCRELK